MLPTELETEVAALAERYGPPRRVSADVASDTFEPLSLRDRFGEVCMVVRRPSGCIITAIKTFYPPGAFRLMTGGIHHGETIEAALLREVREETGLDVAVRRFLAVIEYNGSHPFATFAFLLDELGGTLAPTDASEQIGTYREVELGELPALAQTLEQCYTLGTPERIGSWRDWGAFRAIVHRVVYEVLAGDAA
ncbi:MAG: NUDIX hydrolase [Roseiflexaceae bacterium]